MNYIRKRNVVTKQLLLPDGHHLVAELLVERSGVGQEAGGQQHVSH